MTDDDLAVKYTARFNSALVAVTQSLQAHVSSCLSGFQRIDRISARAKAVDRFLEKAARLEDGKPKYSDPLEEIQDQWVHE